MSMYSSNVDKNDYNVTLDGVDLIAEEFTSNEAYNRRETSRKSIIGGTQSVIRTNYIPRDYSFTTHLLIDPYNPDVYDETFRLWQSKPVEVVSKYMGGKFNAEVIVTKNEQESANYLSLEIQVIEIPEVESLIPNDNFIAPETKVVKTEAEKKAEEKSKKEEETLNTKLMNCKVPFRINDKNKCVELLQTKLINMGYLNKKAKTSKYDTNTVNAVKKYQKSTNGKLLVDGIFGKYTRKSMLNR